MPGRDLMGMPTSLSRYWEGGSRELLMESSCSKPIKIEKRQFGNLRIITAPSSFWHPWAHYFSFVYIGRSH
jgi:hypothetical protein